MYIKKYKALEKQLRETHQQKAHDKLLELQKEDMPELMLLSGFAHSLVRVEDALQLNQELIYIVNNIHDILFEMYAGGRNETKQSERIKILADNGNPIAVALLKGEKLEKITLEVYKEDTVVKGGKNRVANDPQCQAMNGVREEYKKRCDNGSRFPSGRLSEFYTEMASKQFYDEGGNKFSLDFSSIKNAIEKLRKQLKHTKPKKKKQSS